MAARKQPYPYALSLLFLALSTLPCIISSASVDTDNCTGPGDIAVYWGQHTEKQEGSLTKACDSRLHKYGIVIISHLLVSDANASTSPPTLLLADHCGNSLDCSILASEIKHCQDLGVKVFLSLVMETMLSSPPSKVEVPDFSRDLATYLVENFLTGDPGPLGAVSLDGINIENKPDTRHVRWDRLVTLIHGWSSLTHNKVYISASPSCPYDQDSYLDDTIRTGYVDYIWVEFYGHHPSCIYKGNIDNLLGAWQIWTTNVTRSKIFLGLTANETMEGYIPPEVVKTQILPAVKKASNYGGVMIWDRYYDQTKNYAPQIRDSVPKICKCDCSGNVTAFTGFNSLLARS